MLYNIIYNINYNRLLYILIYIIVFFYIYCLFLPFEFYWSASCTCYPLYIFNKIKKEKKKRKKN